MGANEAIARLLTTSAAMLLHSAPTTKGGLARVRAAQALIEALHQGVKAMDAVLRGEGLSAVAKETSAWIKEVSEAAELINTYASTPELEFSAELTDIAPMYERNDSAAIQSERRLNNYVAALGYADKIDGELEQLGPGVLRVVVAQPDDVRMRQPAPRLAS